MKEYEVFPDYCSTGIWDLYGCVDIPDYVSVELKMLIEYWHGYWECAIDKDFEFYPYFNWVIFKEDGIKIVDLLNDYNIDHYTLRLDED